MPIPMNSDDNLWTNLNIEEPENFLRRFRRTACPVMGDDDIDDDPENPDDSDVPDGEDRDDGDQSPGD